MPASLCGARLRRQHATPARAGAVPERTPKPAAQRRKRYAAQHPGVARGLFDTDLKPVLDRLERLEAKIDRLAILEQRLNSLLTRLEEATLRADVPTEARPAAPAADPYADIRAIARGGQLIEAIKLYRERTRVGLKEAKDAVEAMIA